MKNKVLCYLLVLIIMTSFTEVGVAASVSKNGFTYDTAVYDVTWKSSGSISVYTIMGGKLGTLTYKVGLAKVIGTNDFTLMVKMTMTPNNSKVRVSSSQYGYGFSEYVSAYVTVPGEMGEVRPVNDPTKESVEFSLGYGKDNGSIGVSYTITPKALDITNKSNTTQNKYGQVCNYKPSIANPFASNKYLANESYQYGMVQFETTKSSYTFDFTFDARFGIASDNAASPWKIYPSVVFNCKDTDSFTFSL